MKHWLAGLLLLVGPPALAQQAVPQIAFESVANPLKLPTNMYFGEVKAPTESKSEFDFVNILSTIPGDAAFRPAAESECPALKN